MNQPPANNADLLGYAEPTAPEPAAPVVADLLDIGEYAPRERPARNVARTPEKVIVLPPDPTSMAEKGRKMYLQNQIRQAFHHLAMGNLDAVQGWLHEVAKDSPAKAIEQFIELAKFSLPQLKETTMTVNQNGSTRTYQSSQEILQELNGGGE